LNDQNVPPQAIACRAGFGTCLTGEVLPSTTRTMNFQVTVRDNRAGGGAIATASTSVGVTVLAGPFAVTAPNTALTWAGNSLQTVTWNVANTNGAPLNTTQVKI